jgi:hypothetical protein
VHTHTRAHTHAYRVLRVKDWIQEKVDHYARKHFHGRHVLGVHYRGLDKAGASRGEAPRVSWSKVDSAVRQYLTANPDAYVYLATDEGPFLEWMIERFGEGRVLFLTSALRSAVAGPDLKPVR